MSDVFSDGDAGSIPLNLVEPGRFAEWVDSHARIKRWACASHFKASDGAWLTIPADNGELERIVVCADDLTSVWTLADLPLRAPPGVYHLDAVERGATANNLALGWALGSHQYERFKTARRKPSTLVWPEGADRAEVERLAAATTLARDLINAPAEAVGPRELADAAIAMARSLGAEHHVIEGEALRLGYPAVHAVGRASSRQPLMVDLRWGDPSAPKVTLVGKGVCFDTGGLNLKAREGMLEMKADMGGAAIVLALAQCLMSAEAPIRLRVLLPLVDNAVAGNALRPLDVITMRSGRTVEIGNTDAEGRLILADALTEAGSEDPDLIIDVATLTGAARIALGNDVQAFFCEDETIAANMNAASIKTEDPLWRLPLWRPYRKLIDGRVADLNNVAGAPQGGAITAAVFLSEFVKSGACWVHADVLANNPADRPGRPRGGDATGLRALYAFLRDRYVS